MPLNNARQTQIVGQLLLDSHQMLAGRENKFCSLLKILLDQPVFSLQKELPDTMGIKKKIKQLVIKLIHWYVNPMMEHQRLFEQRIISCLVAMQEELEMLKKDGGRC